MIANQNHAIVIGASIAGLLAARVLSERYGTVTLIEKDALPDEPAHRRHVPQSAHVHNLLASGLEAITSLFPGFDRELMAHGGRIGDAGRDLLFVINGRPHCRRRSGLRMVTASRILLEHLLRERVRALPGVRWFTGCEVTGLVLALKTGGITGVYLRGDHGSCAVAADLVVDCSGRGSRMAAWLAELGYEPPPVEELRMDVRYRSRHFRLPEAAARHDLLAVAASPGCPRFGVIGREESGLHLCTLGGLNGEAAPSDLAGFLDYARSLESPEVYEALRQAEPMSELRGFGTPSNIWRRYESLLRFPRGLLVMGDAVCGFNPSYAQGMSVAALEALELRRWLAGRRRDARKWFRAIAAIIQAPWMIATGGDAYNLGMPEAERLPARWINRYFARVHAAAATDPIAAETFARVAQLCEPPTALMRPSMMWRVLGRTEPPAREARELLAA